MTNLKYSLLLAFGTLVCSPCALAQSSPSPDRISNNLSDLSKLGKVYTVAVLAFDTRYEGVKGSPMLFEDWMDGTITLSDGREVSHKSTFNIDAEKSVVVVRFPSGKAIAVEHKNLQSVSIDSGGPLHIFESRNSAEVEGDKRGEMRLYEVLYADDNSAFLKRDIKDFKAANYKGAYSQGKRYDEYVQRTEYYLKYHGAFSKIKLKKKSIVRVAPELAEKIKGAEITEGALRAVLAQR